jgi:hypothetical protein
MFDGRLFLLLLCPPVFSSRSFIWRGNLDGFIRSAELHRGPHVGRRVQGNHLLRAKSVASTPKAPSPACSPPLLRIRRTKASQWACLPMLDEDLFRRKSNFAVCKLISPPHSSWKPVEMLRVQVTKSKSSRYIFLHPTSSMQS